MRDHALDVSFDSDVRPNEAGSVPERTRESLTPLLTAAGDHDPGALVDEQFRGTSADAAGSACDDCDLTGECHDLELR
jgi:hypothetical protein